MAFIDRRKIIAVTSISPLQHTAMPSNDRGGSRLSSGLATRVSVLKHASQLRALLVYVKNAHLADASPTVDERIARVAAYIAENGESLEFATSVEESEDEQLFNKVADLVFCTNLAICAVATAGSNAHAPDNTAALEAAKNLFRLD